MKAVHFASDLITLLRRNPEKKDNHNNFWRYVLMVSHLNMENKFTKRSSIHACTPAIVFYYIYLCIELLPANAHSHMGELVFEMCFLPFPCLSSKP